MKKSPPAHHRTDGRFRIPWPMTNGRRAKGGFLRWQWERLIRGIPPVPANALRVVDGNVAYPRADEAEVRITWIGHATFLIQIGGLNVLTDPIWSDRASPIQWAGPKRLVPPGLEFDRLPPVDAVILSHDHFDHLDEQTVLHLHRRFGDDLQWYTPLGYARWFERRRITNVQELDWWDETALVGESGTVRVVSLPAQHWTRRSPLSANSRLWSSWALLAAGGPRVYFAGDSGYFAGFADIGAKLGPFDYTLLPIGAYEPRWFMQLAHMNPEEAVRAYLDLGGRGELVAMHWGTFRLSDEGVLEPAERVRIAWSDAGLPEERLRVLRHGETLVSAL